MSSLVIRGARRASALSALALLFTVAMVTAPAQAQDGAPSAAATPAEAERADTVQELFRRANELAFAQNYAAALEVYGALTDVGIVDPDVEQNMAVCHARLGDLPRAIFHFERSLLLRPDEGVEQALAAAEDALARARAEEEGEAELVRDTHFARALVRGVSERALAVALLLGVAALCLALVVRRRVVGEVPRVIATLAALFIALWSLGSGSGLVIKQGWLRDGAPAVILDDTVALHQSPDARSPVLETPARGGERAMILDEYEGFVRVRLGARQGWAERDQVGRLR